MTGAFVPPSFNCPYVTVFMAIHFTYIVHAMATPSILTAATCVWELDLLFARWYVAADPQKFPQQRFA